MKRNILYFLAGFSVLFSVLACSEDNKYETSVVRNIEIFLNDEAWSLNVGISTKPLFIYKENGEYFANYTSHYRFQLPNGKYKILSTLQPDSIPCPKNLSDVIIRQDPAAKMKYEISAPVEYNSPFDSPLSIRMYNRTGTLRLKATDKKADKSYATVRAIVTTPISGYRLADATYVKSPLELTRSKETNSGGVNYTDDFVIFETESLGESVSIQIDYLDKDGNVVQSKPMEGTFTIVPNAITQIDFQLNDTEHPIIQDYTVTILPEGWSEEVVTPEAPIEVPEGYTYVAPSDNLETVCNTLFDDPQVSELKLFLKAGTVYNLGRLTIRKDLSILGQEPGKKQERASLNMGNADITGDISTIRFEGIDIQPTDDYLFRFSVTSLFNVDNLTFSKCSINGLNRSFLQDDAKNALGAHAVDRLVIDNCRIMNFQNNDRNYPFITMTDGNPIRNIEMKHSTLHSPGTKYVKTLIEGTRGQTDNITVNLENCTFVRSGNTSITFFDLRADKMENITLVLKNNLFSGISEAGKGRWMYLDKKAVKDFSDNYRTSDYVLSNWGVDGGEEPIASVTKEELFVDFVSGDLTIKDKTSEVYTKRIGDPHWIK